MLLANPRESACRVIYGVGRKSRPRPRKIAVRESIVGRTNIPEWLSYNDRYLSNVGGSKMVVADVVEEGG